MTQYTYSEGTDGCDSTFDVYDPRNDLLTSIRFWERREEAEEEARLIVDALNAFKHTNPKWMTTEQLEKHVRHLHGNWMFHEAAERGYDFAAASQASREHSEAKAELDRRKEGEKGILELAADLKQACDELIASTTAA